MIIATSNWPDPISPEGAISFESLQRMERARRCNPFALELLANAEDESGLDRFAKGAPALLGSRPIWLRPDVAAAIMIHGMLEGLLTGPAHHQRLGLRWPDRRLLRGFPRGADLRRMEQVWNVRADIGNGNRASHPEVTAIGGLQQALKMLGYRITVDGDCGRETRKVVASFQTHDGLVADGVCGPRTEAELRRELATL